MTGKTQHDDAQAGKASAERARILDRFFNPSIEHLVSKYLEYTNCIELLYTKQEKSPFPEEEAGDAKDLTIRFCQDKLQELHALLFPSFGMGARVIAAWQLLHRVSEEMILLMTREELIGFGVRLKRQIATMAMPEMLKKEWTDIVKGQLAKVAKEQVPLCDLRETRQLFKNIYRSVNDAVDDQFWDLWAKKFLAFSYTLALALLTAIFFVGELGGGPCLSLGKILLLGAMGGLMSGVFTSEGDSLPKGHFWVPTLYYLLARPLMGLLAALVIFWAVESQFLVAIEPPYGGRITTCETEKKDRGGTAIPEISTLAPATVKDEGEVKVSPVTMKARTGREHYLYMLLFLCAGFAGDKLLKAIADRVTAKLIARAEKTKEPKT